MYAYAHRLEGLTLVSECVSERASECPMGLRLLVLAAHHAEAHMVKPVALVDKPARALRELEDHQEVIALQCAMQHATCNPQ